MQPAAPPHRAYKYYDLIMAAFVCVLLCANLIGVSKVAQVTLFGHFAFGAGNLFFPLSYLFGDVLTEVYGYARSRRVVWAGFAALALRLVHELHRRAPAAGAEAGAGQATSSRRPSAPPGASRSPPSSATSAASSSTPSCSPS